VEEVREGEGEGKIRRGVIAKYSEMMVRGDWYCGGNSIVGIRGEYY
jgi:hypothetical protein